MAAVCCTEIIVVRWRVMCCSLCRACLWLLLQLVNAYVNKVENDRLREREEAREKGDSAELEELLRKEKYDTDLAIR